MSAETYKVFPPGLGLLKIPTHSRAAALAGLSMYSPCASRGVLAQKGALLATAMLGPRALPGRSIPWTPPMPPDTWGRLMDRWRGQVGHFDGMAIYERVQVHRPGIALLLMRGGTPVGFVKLRRTGAQELRREAIALEALARHRPSTFFVPGLLGSGSVAGWEYVVMEPIPGRHHRVAIRPPIELIAREIQIGLADLERPDETPDHWVPVHGDLTPWNLRELPERRIVIIDWEDCDWAPPGADEVLYRATLAASTGQETGIVDAHEAIEYWEQRLRPRPNALPRDRRLADSLRSALHTMRPAARKSSRRRALKPRVLVFAYACEPERGSEPGAGWGLVRAVERFADCTVLVGPEHTQALRTWKAANPRSTLRFVEVPEPRFAAAAKLHRLTWFLLYQAWLRKARTVARELHAAQAFDVMYHATYATYWLPTPAADFGAPCIWGPVGGAVTTPLGLWRALGIRGIADEVFDLTAVRVASLCRATRNIWHRSAGQIIQNEETLARLPKAIRQRSHVLSHVNFVELPEVEERPRGPHVLWASALEARKGPRLALHALSAAPLDVRLYMVGDGPERKPLERLARKLGIADRVVFLGHLARSEVVQLMSQAACVLFTNLREEGGVALAEAMLAGAPTVVLANGGLRTISSGALDPGRVRLVPAGNMAATARRLAAAMTEFVRRPSSARSANLDQASASARLRAIFDAALASNRHPEFASTMGSRDLRRVSRFRKGALQVDLGSDLRGKLRIDRESSSEMMIDPPGPPYRAAK